MFLKLAALVNVAETMKLFVHFGAFDFHAFASVNAGNRSRNCTKNVPEEHLERAQTQIRADSLKTAEN